MESNLPNKDEIQKLRLEIDRLDQSIADLIYQRVTISEKIQLLKQTLGIEKRDPVRESQILQTYLNKILGVSGEARVRSLVTAIIDLSLSLKK